MKDHKVDVAQKQSDLIQPNMSRPDYQAIEDLVRSAGKMMLQARLADGSVHQKQGVANFYTDYDVAIQRFLIDGFRGILPDTAFYGEENTEGNQGAFAHNGYTFYIDPIDGTTNFMFGYHHSCVSVGLACENQMAAGFVYNPYADEMYTGIRGQGSRLNGRKLEIADNALDQGIVAFGCARYNESDTDIMFDVAKQLYLNSLSIRNGGSAALDLCRIASGNNVAYVELKLQPYDYAAASVIVEEAGGRISKADGSAITLQSPCSIVCGTNAAWEESRRIVAAAGFTES